MKNSDKVGNPPPVENPPSFVLRKVVAATAAFAALMTFRANAISSEPEAEMTVDGNPPAEVVVEDPPAEEDTIVLTIVDDKSEIPEDKASNAPKDASPKSVKATKSKKQPPVEPPKTKAAAVIEVDEPPVEPPKPEAESIEPPKPDEKVNIPPVI